MGYLDSIIGGVRSVLQGGVAKPSRSKLNFLDATVADNEATDSLDVSFASATVGTLAVRAVATTNVALSGTQTIDGVSVLADQLVLLAGQSNTTQNGVWVVKSGAWARTVTAMSPGMVVFVQAGTKHKGSAWVLVAAAPITVGTTPLSFVRLQPLVNVERFGAIADSTTDNADAFDAALAALPSTGGTLYFPSAAGVYLTSRSLTLTGKTSIVLAGAGAPNAGAGAASQLRYTGAGASFIIGNNIVGCTLEKLQITYSNASFTGTLVNFDSSSGAVNIKLVSCFLGGAGVGGAKLLSLDNTESVTIDHCQFGKGTIGIDGPINTAGHFCNNFTMIGGGFGEGGISTCLIRNPGEAWNFLGVAMESLVSGLAGSIVCTFASIKGLTIHGCWIGDVTTTGGTQLLLSGKGISISAGRISGLFTGPAGIGVDIVDGSEGISIHGVNFDSFATAIRLPSSTPAKTVSIGGNYYTNVTNKVSGTPATGYPSILFRDTQIELASDVTFPGTLSAVKIAPAVSPTAIGPTLEVRGGNGAAGFAGAALTIGGGDAGDGSHQAGITVVEQGAPVGGNSSGMFLSAGPTIGHFAAIYQHSSKLTIATLTDGAAVANGIYLFSASSILLEATTTIQLKGSFGAYGVTPTARPAAYTQTYSTGARTVNAYTTDPESSAYTGIDNTHASADYAQLTDVQSLRVAYENLRASHDNLLQVVTQIIDDLQSEGWLQ